MAPEKNTTKRKVPITEVVIKKETRAEKKIDKEASCPNVTVLQEVKKHAGLVSFIISSENRSRNSTKHRARYLFFLFRDKLFTYI